MEILAKIFIVALILGMGVMGCYCVYDINRIREKWRKEGVDEHKLRADFYRALNEDD